MDTCEAIAKEFHGAYERLAPEHGYETRKESAVAWEDVPEDNRKLMTATVADLVNRNVIVGVTCQDAQLGLATTRQLLEELGARGRCEMDTPLQGEALAGFAASLIFTLPIAMLDYRTVDDV